MGDTFPPTLRGLDNRIRTNISSTLSTTYQELGRMCRYVAVKDLARLPYCLVTQETMQFFTQRDVVSIRQFARHVDRLDLQIQRTEKHKLAASDLRESVTYRSACTPHKNSYDAADAAEPEYDFMRVVLFAAPQVGKTGTFLRVVSALQGILPETRDEMVVPDVIVRTFPPLGAHWNKPYWKDVETQIATWQQSGTKQFLEPGKYAPTLLYERVKLFMELAQAPSAVAPSAFLEELLRRECLSSKWAQQQQHVALKAVADITLPSVGRHPLEVVATTAKELRALMVLLDFDRRVHLVRSGSVKQWLKQSNNYVDDTLVASAFQRASCTWTAVSLVLHLVQHDILKCSAGPSAVVKKVPREQPSFARPCAMPSTEAAMPGVPVVVNSAMYEDFEIQLHIPDEYISVPGSLCQL
eukprot:TRINITY_DN493_c0_g1_i8.p1 TRINITY_DN493_c0_g1~~TRINITY_DN493_c0_g1_i8.p1  ORF type:complete len:412 (-),score=68.33 TRINITY_DN493_c0_g1_i8:2398-3633(-)